MRCRSWASCWMSRAVDGSPAFALSLLTRSASLFSSAVRRSASLGIAPRRPRAACDCIPPGALRGGKLFLAARRLVELLQLVVDVRRARARRGRGGLLRLVLILLGVELEIEQAREIAARSPAAAATTAGAERDFDLPEGRLGP